MKVIMHMAKDIKSEIHDAEKYINRAIDCKVMHPNIARMYQELAKKEVSDAKEIHEHVVALIEDKKKTYTPPEYMIEMWNEEHKEIIERITQIKYALEALNQ